MQVINTQIHRGLDFAQYQNLPGKSFSGIKADYITVPQPTAKMQLGTMLHNYLLEPSKYNAKNDAHKVIQAMATEVKSTLGAAFSTIEPELSVTADFQYEGFTMAYKGRIDMARIGKLVIDLKVSEVPLNKSISFFGYDKQVSGYSLAIGAQYQMILRICPKTLKTELKSIPITNDWWKTQVLKYGKI